MPRFAMSPALGNTLKGIPGTVGRAAAPLAVVMALADAAGELGDTDDPMARNFTEAGGQLTGNALGAILGGILGMPLGPVGAMAGAGIGGWLGGGPGQQVAGGVYDLVTGYKPKTEAEKRREQELLDAKNLQQIELARYKQMLPIKGDLLDQRYLDDQRRAQLDLQLKNDYNYQNAINQGLLSAQQNAAILNAGLANI